MDKDQWQLIEKIYNEAMKLPQDERGEFLGQACIGDEGLHRELQALVEANSRTETLQNPPHAAKLQPPSGFSSARMKHCPKCGKIYPVVTRVCQIDNELLSLKDPYHLLDSTLIDKYKILALVGVGGMGAVYCAQHVGIGRRVALKILQPNLAIGNEYVMELFEREAKLAGRLTHENIVDVKDAGITPDGIAYIAMEWLEGRTLDEELQSHGRFGFQRAIGIIRQITRALGAAHAERIIHRDLKPANIMLVNTPDGHDQVKVLDFGIGKVMTDTTASSTVSALVGTPHYASPEQLTMGAHVDTRSDIYSLGVILYRMLGGELPFDCSSIGQLLHLQLTASPPLLGAIRPETPEKIQALINRMLAKDPDARPQNPAEMSELLDRIEDELKSTDKVPIGHDSMPAQASAKTTNSLDSILNHPTVMETQVSVPQPARNRRAYLIPAVVSAVVLLAAGYAFYKQFPDSEAREPVVITPSATVSTPTPEATLAPTPEPVSSRELVPSPDPARSQIQANQQKAAEHLRRAQSLYQQADYQDALRECNESLKLNPRQPEARQLKQKITEILRILNKR